MPKTRQWNFDTQEWDIITFREPPQKPREENPRREQGRISNENLITWWLEKRRFRRLPQTMTVYEDFLVHREEIDEVRIEAYEQGYNDALEDNQLPLPDLPGRGSR